MFEILKNILLGVGAGLVFGIMGYLKSPGEEFDAKKFLQTVVVGCVVGGIGGFMGMKPGEAQEYLQSIGVYGGVVTMTEYVKKCILRRLGVGGEA